MVAGGTVDLYGGNDAVGSLSGAGTVTNSSAGSLSVLSVGGTMQTFSGSLQDGAGTLGLTVNAPGQILTGANSYSGTTTINGGGTLQLGNGAPSHDGSIYAITGTGTVNNYGTLLYNLAGSQTASYAIGPATGSGVVTKTGSGTLTLNGINLYNGGTNVLQGLMVVAPGSSALPTGPLYVSGGSLDLEGNSSYVTTLGGSGTIGNGASAGNTSYLTVETGGTWAGMIQDGGFGGAAQVGLVLSSGTLTLTGVNAYTAGTFVFGGELDVNNPNAIEDSTNLYVGLGTPFGTVVSAEASAAPASVQSAAAAAVPEPGTLALLAVAATAVAAAARRTRKNRRRA